MTEDNSIVRLRQPDAMDDPLTALLRSGARQLFEQAIEAEVAAFLASMKDLKLADGRDRLVREGHGPEHVTQTGIRPLEVQRVKVRDRAAGPAAERIRFSSALCRAGHGEPQALDALLPILYLRGISAGDFRTLSLSRLNHWLPRGQAHPEVMQGTAEFHHQIADALLPQADPVFDDATALDTAVDMLDPQPTVVQRLVGPLLLQVQLLAAVVSWSA